MTATHTREEIASAYATLDLAQKHHGSLNMGVWALSVLSDGDPVELAELESECGTTACYAGWHAARLGYKVDSDGYASLADGGFRHVADITRADLGMASDAADGIFVHTSSRELPAAIEAEFGPRPR